MLPLSTPVVTSGLTYIKIQLVKAEVASAVCLRLHRPRDASTLGLSQIKLLGLTAFGTTSSATVNNPFLPSEDQVSKTRYVYFLLLKMSVKLFILWLFFCFYFFRVWEVLCSLGYLYSIIILLSVIETIL